MNRIISCSLAKAIYDDNLEKLEKLIQVGKRTYVQDNLGWTAVHAAVAKNRSVASHQTPNLVSRDGLPIYPVRVTGAT